MLHVDYTKLREVTRNPQKISEKVNHADVSFVVMSNNKPLFVLISVKNFSELQRPPAKDEGLSLLGLIDWAEKKNIAGPKDLSENHDKYLWENDEQEKQ